MEKEMKVCIIGTGFAGICMAIQLKQAGIEDFTILEKANGLGGTWRENTYPGAECDIPSALYSFSFELYPYWEYKWSHQPQILQYLKHCSQKYGLEKHIQYGKELSSAHFQEDIGKWKIRTKDNTSYLAKFLIMGIGQLHHPQVPVVKGQETFQGTSFHSAVWQHDVSLENKNIAVIGNAASAIQFIPEIADTAKSLFVFQRSANWMLPKMDRAYHDLEKKIVSFFPDILKYYRFSQWLRTEFLYLILNGSVWLQKLAESFAKSHMQGIIKDPGLRKKLTPEYPFGAKRVLFSDNYYQSLVKENVHLVMQEIQEIGQSSIVTTDGRAREIDILIYATGFKTNPFFYNLTILGRGNRSIHEVWKEGAEAYLGITTNGFPNLFMLYGPNTNLGHSSIIFMIECQVNYIIQAVQEMEKTDSKFMDVNDEVQKSYNAEIQAKLSRSVWNKVDTSWYKQGGKITNNWPGNTLDYEKITKKFDISKYELI